MRSTRALAPIFLALLLAACGGSGASDDGGGDGPASEAAGTAQPTETPGGGGDGNGSSGDLDQLAEDLTPPDSSETSRTTAGGIIFLTFESSRSPDDLESFYEGKITSGGFEIFSRTSAEGTYSWIFQDPGDNSFGGVVTVTPSGEGSGSLIGVQVGSGE